MPNRDFEMNHDEMIIKMENVGARAADLLIAAQREWAQGKSPGQIYMDRALSMVGECHEMGCPPPAELVKALAVVFRQKRSRRAPTYDETQIAGDDPGALQRNYRQRLIAEMFGIKANSIAAFKRAAQAELAGFALHEDNPFQAPVNRVAGVAEVDRQSVREWRSNPGYLELVRSLLGE